VQLLFCMYDPVVVIAPVVIFRLFLLARESHTNLSVLCVDFPYAS
jgi:hypothetical protein